MQIGKEVVALMLLLHLDKLPNRSEVVADVQRTGGLHSR
jgi:hypothetical protein